jgi:hypothetical protein
MDEDALAFLERWVEVHAVAKSSASRSELAEKLAGQCYRDAEEAGFDADAIDEAAAEATDGEDLIAYIELALEGAEDGDEDDEEE